MSDPLSSRTLAPPLSVGNIVTAGLHIYRAHFKLYLRLALIAHLWLIVPLYGWAKFFTISALISRLAFNEFFLQPEPIQAAQKFVNSRKMSFLKVPILVNFLGIIFFVCIFLLMLLFLGVFTQNVTLILESVRLWNNKILGVAIAMFFLVAIAVTFAVFIALITWFYAHFFIVEVLLAKEENPKAVKAIFRSWALTQTEAKQITGIIAVAFLVTLPAQVIIQGLNFLQPFITFYFNPKDSPIIQLMSLGIILAMNILIMPLWQSIKAVLYYDLLNRREGLGLRFRVSVSVSEAAR